MTNSLVEFLTVQFNREAAQARYARDRNAELPQQLRSAGERVKDMYGDPEPPEDEVNPADRIWWLAKDAADWVEQHGPAQILADIEAKRRTLVRCEEAMLSSSPMLVHFAKQTVWEMAQPYSSRPGFREDWRP